MPHLSLFLLSRVNLVVADRTTVYRKALPLQNGENSAAAKPRLPRLVLPDIVQPGSRPAEAIGPDPSAMPAAARPTLQWTAGDTAYSLVLPCVTFADLEAYLTKGNTRLSFLVCNGQLCALAMARLVYVGVATSPAQWKMYRTLAVSCAQLLCS